MSSTKSQSGSWKAQIRSCYFPSLNSFMAPAFTLTWKIPIMVYQVLFDRTPQPLPAFIYYHCAAGSLYSSPDGPLGGPQVGQEHSPSRLLLWPRGCSSLGTFWSLLFRETISKRLGTRVTLCFFFPFNCTHLHLALHDGRNSWAGTFGSLANGQGIKSIPRRRRVSTQCRREDSMPTELQK